MFSVTHNRVARMRLPGPPVRMLSNNSPQVVVICALQMDRVSVQMVMGEPYTCEGVPVTADTVGQPPCAVTTHNTLRGTRLGFGGHPRGQPPHLTPKG